MATFALTRALASNESSALDIGSTRRRSKHATRSPHRREAPLHGTCPLHTLDRRHLRKQYFFRTSPGGLLAWDVDRLVVLSRDIATREVPLDHIRELDEPWHGDGEHQTWRGLVEHVRLMDVVDLSYPIILSADGMVMDGMHRVCQSLRLGRDRVAVRQFETDPPPDHVGKRPEDLPYDL